MTEIPVDILTGQTERHLGVLPGKQQMLHIEVVPKLASLQQAATIEGFQLEVASGFRSFERQLAIWNAKAHGERPVLDDQGNPFDITRLSSKELVVAIMRWSALPGASRHHWGTDFDIWDTAAVPSDYHLQLVPEECAPDGPFGPLHQWLDQWIEQSPAEFFRPYDRDHGGVAPERWHLSYRPVAAVFEKSLTPGVLADTLAETDIALKSTILEHLDELFERFIRVG